MVLTLIILLPLLGSVAVAAVPRANATIAKQVALAVSLATFALTVAAAIAFDTGRAGDFQLTQQVAWIPSFGIDYAVGVDGIALALLAMTTTLVPIVILAGWHDADLPPALDDASGTDAGGTDAAGPHAGATGPSTRGYFALILALEAALVGVFVATDVFLFYVLFEVMLIPAYFLIGRYGGAHRAYAAVKFLLYSLFGGLLMLAALIGLYVASGGPGKGTFDFVTLAGITIDPGTQKWLFLGFFAAFAIKAPLVPFHTWLPDAAAESTPATAVLLVAVMDKVGTFGMIRYCLELFPDASVWATPVVIVLAVVSVLYGALLAIGQTDIKRLIAYTSISHFGFITLGIFVMTTRGQSGSTLYMVSHGFSTAALFLIGGFLMSRRGSRLVDDYGGVAQVAPVLAGTFLVAGLSSLALPGLSSFVGEFLVLLGTFERYVAAAVVATLGIVLAAIYILWLYQRTMSGPPSELVRERVHDLRGREVLAIAPLLAITIAIGVAPGVLLRTINPAVDRVMAAVGQSDPPPVTPSIAATSVAATSVDDGATP